MRNIAGIVAWILFAIQGQAGMPEPDAIIYGSVQHRFNEPLISATAGVFTLIAEVNGIMVASCDMPSNTNRFVLRIRMDNGQEPRIPGAATGGEMVHLLLRQNATSLRYESIETAMQPLVLPLERGPVIHQELSFASNLLGIPMDTDGDGLPDFWENHYSNATPGINPLSPIVPDNILDNDHDGLSNEQEWLVGTNPLDPASKLSVWLTREDPSAPVFKLSFGTAYSGKTYLVLVADCLDSGLWHSNQVVHPHITGTHTLNLPLVLTNPAFFIKIGIYPQ